MVSFAPKGAVGAAPITPQANPVVTVPPASQFGYSQFGYPNGGAVGQENMSHCNGYGNPGQFASPNAPPMNPTYNYI